MFGMPQFGTTVENSCSSLRLRQCLQVSHCQPWPPTGVQHACPPPVLRPPTCPSSPLPPTCHPQLVRYDQGGLVERFLLDAAQRSVYFAHMLICQLLSEGTPPEEAFNPAVRSLGRVGGRRLAVWKNTGCAGRLFSGRWRWPFGVAPHIAGCPRLPKQPPAPLLLPPPPRRSSGPTGARRWTRGCGRWPTACGPR